MARWRILVGIVSLLFLLQAGMPARSAQADLNASIAALQTGDDDVRQQAAQTLVTIGAPAVAPLLKVLSKGDAEARFWSTWALGRLKDSRAVKPLATVLKGDADAFVRWGALQALGGIGGSAAVDAQIGASKDDDAAVRAAALAALGRGKDPRAFPVLLALLTGEDRALRGPAATALGAYGDPRAVKPLIELLSDDWGANRETAREALLRIGVPAIAPLIAALADARQPWEILNTLARIGAPAVDPLIAALKTKGQGGRQWIIQALTQIPNSRPTEWLSIALADAETSVRMQAVQLCRRFLDEKLLDLLLPLAKDADLAMRRETALALISYNHPRAIEAKVALLGDADSLVRQYAVSGLAQPGATSVVAPLIDLLKREGDLGIRNTIVNTLGSLQDARAIEPIVEAVRKNTGLRWSAQRSLYQIGPAAAPAVLPLLKETDANLLGMAVNLLGNLKERKAIEPLIVLLETMKEDPQSLKAQIRNALIMITGLKIDQDAAAWRKWWEGQPH